MCMINGNFLKSKTIIVLLLEVSNRNTTFIFVYISMCISPGYRGEAKKTLSELNKENLICIVNNYPEKAVFPVSPPHKFLHYNIFCSENLLGRCLTEM